MRRALAAALIAVLVAACGSPERWETRGFDSEADCWLNHGWDGSVDDGVNRNAHFDFWCGPEGDG